MKLIDLVQEGSPAWRALVVRAKARARTPWPLILNGARGTGKTHLARFIHEHSGRRGEFVARPAPSIPDGLLQAEFLGHIRGAYTDAREEQKGLLELAHQGTLFLDEIEAASPDLQAFLVGQVEALEVRRLRAARSQQLDVRYLYATNARLAELVEQGRFRADLLDRIGGLALSVPPLREYKEMIGQIATCFLQEFLPQLGGANEVELSMDVELALQHHDWPGNLRELRNVCREVAIALNGEALVRLEHLPPLVSGTKSVNPYLHAQRLLRERMEAALAAAQGNKSAAARELGMSRTRFTRMLARLCRDASPGPGLQLTA